MASCCSSIAPISPWSGTPPTVTARSAISSASSNWWSERSTRRCATFRATACACMCAGATTKARTTATCRWPTSCLPILQANVGCLVAAVREPAPRARVPAAGSAPLARRSADRGRRDRHPDEFRGASRKWSPTVSSGSRRPSAIRSRVLAGTDCGFDTSAGMGRVAEDVVWAKLRALADGARVASQRLFAS